MKRPLPSPDLEPGTIRIYGNQTRRPLPNIKRAWHLTLDAFTQQPIYNLCTVEKVDESSVVIRSDDADRIMTVPYQTVLEADEHFLFHDAAQLKAMNYPNVLNTMKQRFLSAKNPEQRNYIYTYAGWIIFAVNPYYPCEEIFTDQWCEKYYRKSITQVPPHPFALADTAFSKAIADKTPQYVLISGESGGGKTECSKHVIKYLTWVTRRQRRLKGRSSVGGPGDAAESLANLLIAANPLLEFFGNAKTARNMNSSRFGKLLQIYYDSKGEHLLTAHLSTYLLAKSRVVQVPNGEENYHVFHALIEGLDSQSLEQDFNIPEDFSSPFLGKVRSASYKTNGNFNLAILTNAMDQFEINDATKLEIFKIIAVILHIGNIQFEPSTSDCTVIKNVDNCKTICKLLGIQDGPTTFIEKITSKQIRDTRSRLNPDQSRHVAFSLAKGLYEAVFDHIVEIIQLKLRAEESRFSWNFENPTCCVGVLDLFGFENMEPSSSNGFEQLCINYANEALHSHFMKVVIQREVEICGNDGIEVAESVFADSKAHESLEILLGYRGSPGIFGALEDASKFGGQDPDSMFCRTTNALLAALKSNKNNSPNKQGLGDVNTTISTKYFRVEHFAEPVSYKAEGFIDRNQDHLSEGKKDGLINPIATELRKFLSISTDPYVQKLFPLNNSSGSADDPVQSNKKGSKSLSSTFIKQMSTLTASLEQTSCYFIKCLKPNDYQRAYEFNDARILRQLVTGGVGPVLERMKLGYPCRLTYSSLWDKYSQHLPDVIRNALNPRDFADLVLRFLEIDCESYRLGTSRIFFRFGALQVSLLIRPIALQKLDDIMQNFDGATAIDLARKMHKYYILSKVARIFCTVTVGVRLTRLFRRLRVHKLAAQVKSYYHNFWIPRKRQRAATVIQKHIKALKSRFLFLKQLRAVRKIQTAYRIYSKAKILNLYARFVRQKTGARLIFALLMRKQLKNAEQDFFVYDAATRIQATWRGYKVRMILRQEQMFNAACAIQRAWRQYNLRKEQSRSPVAGHSRLRCRVKNSEFRDKRIYWELSSAHPHLQDDAIITEIRRRRRSVFCGGLPPTPSRRPAVCARGDSCRMEEFYSPIMARPAGEQVVPLTPIISTAFSVLRDEDRMMISPPYDDAAPSFRESTQKTRPPLPAMPEPAATTDERLQISRAAVEQSVTPTDKFSTRVSAFQELIPVGKSFEARVAAEAGSRMSVRAWRLEDASDGSAQPGFGGMSSEIMTPVTSKAIRTSTIVEEAEGTPLFGSRIVTSGKTTEPSVVVEDSVLSSSNSSDIAASEGLSSSLRNLPRRIEKENNTPRPFSVHKPPASPRTLTPPAIGNPHIPTKSTKPLSKPRIAAVAGNKSGIPLYPVKGAAGEWSKI